MSSSRLEQAFLDDHRHLTRGFQALIEAVEQKDVARSKKTADELDRIAGPHIEFEERLLYPRVQQARGSEFSTRLLQEHQVARSAILFLKTHDDTPLSTEDRARVLEQLRVGLDHAVSCGTLLSHLSVLSDSEQAELLQRLEELKAQDLRWTELSGHLSTTTPDKLRQAP